jgi:hypothetical protein
VTARWALMPDEPVALLLRMQGATSIHDAYKLAIDAVKAGASQEQVRAAINSWMSVQADQVQTISGAEQ